MTGEERLAAAVEVYLLAEGDLSRPYAPGPAFDSPIERLFFLAIKIASELGVTWFDLKMSDKPEYHGTLYIKPQYTLIDWPVDYAFFVKSEGGKISRLAVECDGHDYHERTKEQAARDRLRDRRLQEKGIAVYRFTGSELYRDAFGCARQVIEWAEKAAWLELHEGK